MDISQYLNHSIFSEIVIRYTNLTVSEVDCIWNNMTEFQHQHPRTYAYILCGRLNSVD